MSSRSAPGEHGLRFGQADPLTLTAAGAQPSEVRSTDYADARIGFSGQGRNGTRGVPARVADYASAMVVSLDRSPKPAGNRTGWRDYDLGHVMPRRDSATKYRCHPRSFLFHDMEPRCLLVRKPHFLPFTRLDAPYWRPAPGCRISIEIELSSAFTPVHNVDHST